MPRISISKRLVPPEPSTPPEPASQVWTSMEGSHGKSHTLSIAFHHPTLILPAQFQPLPHRRRPRISLLHGPCGLSDLQLRSGLPQCACRLPEPSAQHGTRDQGPLPAHGSAVRRLGRDVQHDRLHTSGYQEEGSLFGRLGSHCMGQT